MELGFGTLWVISAKNETTSYSYNSVGYVTAITNGRGFARTYAYTDRGQVASLTLADGTVESWAYNGNGETTAYVNPLGQTINYVFDNAGQMTGVDYPVGLTDTSFSYDNAGRQVAMVDGTGTSSWSYNAASEITGLNTPQGNLTYAYNLAGQISSMVDVGVGTTSASYDSAGRPVSVTDAFGDVSSYVYDSAGRLSRKNNPNGTYELYTYDSRNRVTSIVTKNSSNVTLQSRVYTFDLASQVTQVVEGSLTSSYGYDAIGQLTSESKSSGYSASYSYDANGNRLSRTVNGVTESYSYDSGDKLLSVTGGSDPRTFAYDAAGRTTGIVRSSGTTTFSYDYESRVTSITRPGMVTNTFTYNGLDTRVGMVDSSGSKSFKRNGVYVTDPVLSDGTASFTPSGEVRGGVKTTFHSSLKNDDVQTSASQVIGAAKVFDAYGNELSSTGAWKSQFGYAGKFGYQQDADSGLKLLWHRYFDSSTGRFLTRDPIRDGRNWYSYCENNSTSQTDPNGLDAYVWTGFSGGTVVQGQVVVSVGTDSNGDIILGFDIGGGWFAGVGGSIGGMGYRDDMEPGSTHDDTHGGSVNGQIGPIGAEFPITDKKGLDIGKGRYGIGNGLGFGLNYGRSWRWNISAYLRKVQRGIRDMLDYGRGILDEVVRGITSDIGKPVDWSPLRGVPYGRPF